MRQFVSLSQNFFLTIFYSIPFQPTFCHEQRTCNSQLVHHRQYIHQKMFHPDHIYHSPQLIHAKHFPNKDGKGSTHSKDPRNCPVVLFYDNAHFKYISFLLRDPIIVMPILDYTITREDFDRKYKVEKDK